MTENQFNKDSSNNVFSLTDYMSTGVATATSSLGSGKEPDIPDIGEFLIDTDPFPELYGSVQEKLAEALRKYT